MASSCLNWLESIEEWSKKWDKISHQKSNKSDIDDRSGDESHINLRGERDVIRLRKPTEDKKALSTDVNECWPLPRGFSARASKLLSRLFSRPDWPPLGLRRWDIIKEFPVIYNRACADFKDRNIKNNSWRKISELLDLEESDTKALGKLFQGTYGRHLGKVALAEMTFS